ncbi:flagellin domain-containing protein Fli [Alkalihalophilus pseudofirmus OF4]|uniref:Flagellin n=1 Tax=Alkalihalophilus pseudofirmus (strain ATCC BAA-2126 / JCM 17055 / OF4) TaxID=398511 RepID=D3FYG4_ALKPO|nr:flagellin [Alkalihalophilus pseudofirmus]ADC49187.1 flagellin domain-containing protein Fli [Alkalihalophilus pseudofirmus OF4]
MIINNNIPALNTYRQMGVNQQNGQNAMEKLASGLRINRAGDDAAGLAISEKMRGQIRGLDQASRNSQDGISLIQTAEGALQETHSILQRMRELAVQSSNDTNNDKDREELQKEVDQLAQEITRIADNTEFNTKNLMGENGFSGKFHIGANAGQDITLSIDNMTSKALGVNEATASAVDVGDYASVKNNTETEITIEFAALGGGAEISETTAVMSEDGTTITVTLAQAADNSATASKQDVIDALKGIGEISVLEKDVDLTADAAVVTDITVGAATIDTSKGIDISSSQAAASSAITTINSAIETVSAERSKLGAVQNRLEHTISNLNNSSENLQAAESRIRDVDMAREVMEMTKNNILSQASQAMLAQANQAPQAVLQLLG